MPISISCIIPRYPLFPAFAAVVGAMGETIDIAYPTQNHPEMPTLQISISSDIQNNPLFPAFAAVVGAMGETIVIADPTYVTNEIVEQPPPPTDMRPKKPGPMVRACDQLALLFGKYSVTSPCGVPCCDFFEQLVNIARPQSEKSAKAMARRCGELKYWVTREEGDHWRTKACIDGDLSFLDDEDRVAAAFTDPAFCPNKKPLCEQGDASKRQMCDAIRMMYLCYPNRDAGRLKRYFDAYRTYSEREAASALSPDSKVSPEELANTPTKTDIDVAHDKTNLQGKALIALLKKFQGRRQNLVLTVLKKNDAGGYRRLNGEIVAVEEDGFPGGFNAYVLHDEFKDGRADEYIQNVYKTKDKLGKKVGFVPRDCAGDVRNWVSSWGETTNESLFLTTEGLPVNPDTATALCKRIFFEAIGKNVTPGLLRRACANTKEIRDAIAVLVAASEVRNHSFLMECRSGFYAFKGPQSD